MVNRLRIYFRQMYPLIPRLFLGFLLFFEIYFLVILTNRGIHVPLSVGLSEIVGAVTIFSFLLCLRIADDFKDYTTDLRLFPDRPLPSGQVLKKDLIIFVSVLIPIITVANFLFMNNFYFFMVLSVYGILMSFWFFQKYKIQKNLMLALVTHNPVQLIMNLYTISFACIKYKIPLFTFNNFLILITLYFPGLVWEIVRKIRAPEEETEYVTYSKLFGYKKPIFFVLGVMFLDLLTSSYLLFLLYPWAAVTVLLLYLWLAVQCWQFIINPRRFKLSARFEIYEYLAEASVVFFIGLYLFQGYVKGGPL